MNVPVAPKDEIATLPPDGPGKQLRTMREAQGLDLSQVASQLHLSDSVLQAREADNYESMAGTVFVQGYLRNYARLLGVDVAEVLESFEASRPDKDPVADLSVAKVKHEVRSSHGLVRMISWLLVIGLIVLLVIWWRGYLPWPLKMDELVNKFDGESQSMDGRSAVTKSDIDPSVPVFNVPPEVLGTPQVNPETKLESTASDNSINSTAEPKETESEPEPEPEPTSASLPVVETAESLIVKQIEVAPEAESSISMAPATPATEVESSEVPLVSSTAEEPIEAASAVVISFSGPCWVDVKGANGSYRWFGNQKAGAKLALGGQAPYTLLLGNASVVSIKVNGEDYDLAPHTRANIARFILELN